MIDEAISVTTFNKYIKSIFDSETMLQQIQIFGEITDFQMRTNMTYFTLKDSISQLPCVFFGILSKEIKNGEQIIITGSPNYYVKGGRFNFNVIKIEPYGTGAIYMQFLLLKEKLEKEGLFDLAHKKTMPALIDTIGVVTSQTGAVIKDIINVTQRRNPNVNIVLYPSKVQGENASKTVIEGIKYFENLDKIDAIIVARGGGSLEDLSVFNDENLARCVFECKKFVVSAIGHETDFTIIDFVADLRAPTPSVAAEMLTKDIIQTKQSWKKNKEKLMLNMLWLFDKKNKLFSNQNQNFSYEIARIISSAEKKFESVKNKLSNTMSSYFSQLLYQIAFNTTKLEKLNPNNILKIGYAKINQNSKGISNIKNLIQNEPFDVIMIDGKIRAKEIKE